MKTKGQLFKEKAIELMPHQSELIDVDTFIDSFEVLDEMLFKRSEYLGGMAAVIISMLKKENT